MRAPVVPKLWQQLPRASCPCAGFRGPMDLLGQKRALDDALSENRAELKRITRGRRDTARAAARAWQLSESMRRTALIAYALADYRVEPAVRFLIASGRQRHWPDKTEEELATLVEGHFLDVDETELAAITDMEDPADGQAMKAALPYVEQWRLAEWATRLNTDKGVAPSTEALLHQLEAQRLALPGPVRPEARGTVVDPSARVWASSFRRRWGARYGRIRIREHVPLEEMMLKAGSGNSCPKVSVWGLALSPLRGTKTAAVKRHQFLPRAPRSTPPGISCFDEKSCT